jgi:hypothetical protein
LETDETIDVIAPAGKICPKELSRERITDSDPVTVPNSSYYRRLIAEGSLLIYKVKTVKSKGEKSA